MHNYNPGATLTASGVARPGGPNPYNTSIAPLSTSSLHPAQSTALNKTFPYFVGLGGMDIAGIVLSQLGTSIIIDGLPSAPTNVSYTFVKQTCLNKTAVSTAAIDFTQVPASAPLKFTLSAAAPNPAYEDSTGVQSNPGNYVTMAAKVGASSGFLLLGPNGSGKYTVSIASPDSTGFNIVPGDVGLGLNLGIPTGYFDLIFY
jgi:hypothetical protein